MQLCYKLDIDESENKRKIDHSSASTNFEDKHINDKR